MLFAPFLAVVLLAAAEIYVAVAIAHLIGWGLTVALLLASTVAGLWLARVQGRRAWRALREAVASGVIPDREMGDAALVVAGGALLAVPGFLTDILGILAVTPPTRSVIRRVFGVIFFRRAVGVGVRMGSRATRARASASQAQEGASATAPGERGAKVIPGEVIDGSHTAGNGDTGRP